MIVTSTGFQSGAQIVGESKEVLLLELRAPGDADWQGRITAVHVSATARVPVLLNVHAELVETAHGTMGGKMEVLYPDGTRRDVGEILLEGETAPLGQPPAAVRSVRREFNGSEQLVLRRLSDRAPAELDGASG